MSSVADPPSRVVRISLLDGNVSAEAAGANTFSAAELNGVLTTGDRVYTDPAAEAELEAGQIALRLGGGTDLSVTAMTDALAQIGVAAGSVHLRATAVDAGTVTELDTPEVAVTMLQPGDVRVDVDPAKHTTTVTVVAGQMEVDGPGSSQVLAPGQRVRLHGGNPDAGEQAFTEPLAPADADGLDRFSADRDSREADGLEVASSFVPAGTVGGADLAEYGSWDAGGAGNEFGPVWFPVVAADWRPYGDGHWRYIRPWGWTWVGAEPWGFAPFHYGRWAQIDGRWGWMPGPRVLRPVYAPAMVVFAGGAQFAGTLGFAPGVGITAWFPLGPHEPYVPWYGSSTLYRNRVNASNLSNPNASEVRAFYNQRAVDVFRGDRGGDRVFANRLAATTVVTQASFAAGRSVGNATVHVSAQALAGAPLLARPPGGPERSLVAARPALALPPNPTRPVLAGATASAGRPSTPRSGEEGRGVRLPTAVPSGGQPGHAATAHASEPTHGVSAPLGSAPVVGNHHH